MKIALKNNSPVVNHTRVGQLAIASIATTLLFAFALLFTPAQSFANTHPGGPLSPLTIKTPKGDFAYKVELAITGEQKSKGLMFRRSMPQDQGMLFDFGEPRMVMMWMKNTILSLDMIFMEQDGTIARIAQNTTPFSLDTISSGVPVSYVLELNAGEAARTGMMIGQKMVHEIFSNASK